MKKSVKNLLISVGPGYHPAVRILHGMVKDNSDSKILIFDLGKQQPINEDLKIDCSIRNDEFSKTLAFLKGWLLENRFDLVGVSFMSHHWDIFVEIAKIVKGALPECKIIAGGVHAWLIDPMETMRHCDYVCAAEGEGLYRDLVAALSGGATGPLRIPGLVERDGTGIIQTPVKEYMSMDDLPVPTVGSKDIYYLYSSRDNPVFVNEDPLLGNSFSCVHIGRGCPFKCTYCINSLTDEKRKVRIRSLDNVMSELKTLLAVKKFKALLFMDEIFPLRTEWLKAFADKYKKDVGIPFVITLYPGMLTRESAKLLKEAGLKEVSIGVQSGSERTRKEIYGRTGTNSRILEENKILSGLGVMAYYDFIIKNPFESEEDYKHTLELVRNLKRPFYLKFYTLAYYPKHPITDMALSGGLITKDDVSATIGYLDVTTPHRVAIVDHYPVEERLVVWNASMIKDASRGSVEAAYLLLTSYYGYWFIPRFIVELVRHQFEKGRKGPLMALASLVQFILIMRNNFITRKIHLIFSMRREKGMLYVTKRVCARIFKVGR